MKLNTRSASIRYGSAFLVAILLISTITVFAATDKQDVTVISTSYAFEKPAIQKVVVEEIVYDEIIMTGAPCSADPGMPLLPTSGAQILLPQGTTVKNIEISTSKKISLGRGYYIVPASKPVPISQADQAQPPTPDITVYHSDDEFPGRLVTEIGIQKQRGYTMLVLMLHPVQYIPQTGELLYFSEITVSVETQNDNLENPFFRGLPKDIAIINNRVDNPQITASYQQKKNQGYATNEEYDLLIITTDELKNSFIPLKDAHDAKGTSTVIKTLTDVGGDTAEDIREYIREAYTEMHIEYVLIGGDHDVVPAKMLWVYGLDEETTPYTTYMPSDLYYACLDGPYNYDGDNKWGEPEDGENGSDVDLLAEVYVGRACVGNATEVEYFVDKTISYLSLDYDEAYLNNICMAGEHLGNYGIASWGGNYLDLLIDGSDLDGYVTVGIPSEEYNITKLYDRDWPDHNWPASELIELIDAGTHIIHHDGHANYFYNMKMHYEDLYVLSNTKYCFIYSVGCMSGGFDNPQGEDCIAEYFTSKIPTGAFAGIWNARYGWFWSFSTDGDGTRYTREFVDAIYGENIPEIGKANQDSKEDNIYMLWRSCMRWTYYQLNLFGDPSLAFFTPQNENNPPETPTLDGPERVKTNKSFDLTVSSFDEDEDQVYYYIDWGDGNNSGWIGSYDPEDDITINHTYTKRGFYELTAKAKDTRGAESDWGFFQIEVPKAKNQIVTSIMQWIKVRFPHIYSLLNLLIL